MSGCWPTCDDVQHPGKEKASSADVEVLHKAHVSMLDTRVGHKVVRCVHQVALRRSACVHCYR